MDALQVENSNQINDSNGKEEEDDDLKLPADTLAILNEFLREKHDNENSELCNPNAVDSFEENWQLSQFWYDERTKQTLSKVCLKLILSSLDRPSTEITVALLCCPSLYKPIRKIHANGVVDLFEFDSRFSVFKTDFKHFDYRKASTDSGYLDEFKHSYDIIIADPPFLSEECIQSIAITVDKLKKPTSKVILCSGELVTNWATQYLGLEKCAYQPRHERNLANEFCSYANFALDELI